MAVFPDRIVLKSSTDPEAEIITAIQRPAITRLSLVSLSFVVKTVLLMSLRWTAMAIVSATTHIYWPARRPDGTCCQ